MKHLHTLLEEQILKNFGRLNSLPKEMEKFISEVNSVYLENENSTDDLTRSIEKGQFNLDGTDLIIKTRQLQRLLYEKTTELEKTKIELQKQIDQRIHSDIILRSLYRINQASYEADTLHEMLNRIRYTLGSFMDTTNFFIALYDKETGLLSLPYFIDNNDKFDTFPVGKTLTGYVIAQNKPMMLKREQIEEMVSNGIIEQVGTLSELWLAAPMTAMGEVNGAVVVQSYSNPNAYTEKDLEILNFVAKQIGSLIERKKSEEALRNSEERYRVLVESMTEGVCILDKNGYIKFTNDSLLKMLGYSRDELWGKSPRIVLEKSARQIVVKSLRNRKNGISDTPYKLKLVKKDGTIVNTLVSHTTVFSKRNSYTGSFAIITDVSEFKNAEESIRKYSAELEELNANKDKFFSVIAHDLRSPFITLLGYTEILDEDIDSLTADEVKFFASNIHDSSRNLFNLLENLLEWSRVQTGRIKFSPEPIKLNEQINGVLELFKENAGRKKINLSFEPQQDVQVLADSNMFESIIRNLISNAIKFTEHNGQIKIGIKENESMAYISVEDSGCGISSKNIDKIFKMGEHISTTGTDDEKGTGLGLLLCKEFIIKNGGKIMVNSELGEGSVFSFTLPLIK